MRVPLSLQLTRHRGWLGTFCSGHVPTFLLLRWRQKSKIETPHGPGNNFTCEPRAQTWCQVLGKDFTCPLWRWWSWRQGQCAHLRWRKARVARCDLLCAWIRQLAAFKWSDAAKHGDNFEVKAGGAGKWMGRSDRSVSNHKLPNWRISKRWEVLSEKSSPSAYLISYILSQSICYWTLLGGVRLIWDDCFCFSDTFGLMCYSPVALLLELCSSQTCSQTSTAHKTLWLHGGIPLTPFGFLNVEVCL